MAEQHVCVCRPTDHFFPRTKDGLRCSSSGGAHLEEFMMVGVPVWMPLNSMVWALQPRRAADLEVGVCAR